MKHSLAAMLYKQEYEEKLAGVEKDVNVVFSAAEAVLESKHLQKVMKLILLVGNYMNANSR